MKKTLFVMFALCVSPSLMATPELKGSPAELSAYLLDARKIITINGEADEKVEADQAIITLTIKNEAHTLDGAVQENEQIQNRVKQVLLDGGLSTDKIKAANFSSTPDYGWLKDKPKSYEISREIKVTIANASQLRAIAKVVDSIEEVFMGVMNFEDSAMNENELKAVQKALNTIMDRKAIYEKTFSVTLALVKVVDRPVYAITAAPRMKRDMNFDSASVSGMMMAQESAPSSAQFAGIIYHANVIAEFEVIK